MRQLKLIIRAFYYTLWGFGVLIASMVAIFFFYALLPLEARIKQVDYNDTNAATHILNLKDYLEDCYNRFTKVSEEMDKEWEEIQKGKR